MDQSACYYRQVGFERLNISIKKVLSKVNITAEKLQLCGHDEWIILLCLT